jgi:hypothetical protein
MPVTFQNTILQDLYNNGTTTSAALTAFRTGGALEVDNQIDALDRRIAAFEFVLLGDLPAGQNGAAYPYDREGLRREFLDEVTALLLRRSLNGSAPFDNGLYTAPGTIVNSSGTNGALYPALNKSAPVITNSFGIFDTLSPSTSHAGVNSDGRLLLLNDAGKDIFRSYSLLIDGIFSVSDKLGNNPSREAQVTSAISPLTVDGVTYDRIAQVTGIKTITSGTPPVSSQVPDYQTYLLESTAPVSQVAKSANGDATITGPASSAARRLQITTTEVPPFLPKAPTSSSTPPAAPSRSATAFSRLRFPPHRSSRCRSTSPGRAMSFPRAASSPPIARPRPTASPT